MLDYGYIEQLSIKDILLHEEVKELVENAKDCGHLVQNWFRKFNSIPKDTHDAIRALVPLVETARTLEKAILSNEFFRINEEAKDVTLACDDWGVCSWLTRDGIWEYYSDQYHVPYEEWPKELPCIVSANRLDYSEVQKCFKVVNAYRVTAEGIFDFLKKYVIIKTYYYGHGYEEIKTDLDDILPVNIGDKVFAVKRYEVIENLEKANKGLDSFARFLKAELDRYEEVQHAYRTLDSIAKM